MIFIVLGIMETSKLDGKFMQFAFQYRIRRHCHVIDRLGTALKTDQNRSL